MSDNQHGAPLIEGTKPKTIDHDEETDTEKLHFWPLADHLDGPVGQDFVEAEVEGFFEFGPNNGGSFQFGHVKGDIDYRPGIREGKPSVDFSWERHDEMDPAQGRGWAVLDGEEINGMILFHRGDESRFKARRAKRK